MKLQTVLFLNFFFPNSALQNRGCSLSMDAAYTGTFTVVAWPLNESEAGVDLVLIETSLLFICKFLLISMRTASLT